MPTSVSLSRKASHFLLSTCLLAIALLVPSLLCAQAYFGTVSGELSDRTGALVQGATVVLTDQQKGFEFRTTSDSSGRYLFRSIPPGAYTVTAQVQGFEKVISAPFKVDVNENRTANLTLKVAGISQTVEVGAQAQAIQTEDAETGQVVNRRFINDLPLIDRNIEALTSLAPGVTEMDDQCQEPCLGTNFVSNGSRGATSDILADGVSVTNSEPNGGITSATYVPSPEAVEEFKVQQTNFSAEYGFSGASVVNIITRSGSNKFHGSVYDFVRDAILDARDWFSAPTDSIPPLRRNNYGGTIGGPIIKNKTFFFFDFDGLRETTQRTRHAGVPSDLMRAGNFGEVCTAQQGTFDGTGRCSVDAGQLWDPYLRTYDPNVGVAVRNDPSNFIPFNDLSQYASPGNAKVPLPNTKGDLIDPTAQNLMTYFPAPNFLGGDIYNNWVGTGPVQNYNHQYDIKVDHRFNEKNLASVKYSYQYSNGTPFNCFKNFTDPCQGGIGWSNAHLFAITDTHTFTPSLLMNTAFGFTRGVWHDVNYNPQGVDDPLGKLGFPSYLQSNGFKGVPSIFINSYRNAGFANIGSDPYGNTLLGQDTGHLSVTLDKVHASQELKFGFDGRIHQINYVQTNAPNGFFTFNQDGIGACPGSGEANYTDTGVENCGGDAMASFLIGQMSHTPTDNGNGYDSLYEIQFRPATTNYQYGFFVQDNWKATPKLTLNVGLRYDLTKPRTDRYNRQNWFDPNVASPFNGGSLTYNDPFTGASTTRQLTGGEVFASAGHRTNYVTDWSDFQPRFGFAYQFAPKMVVRGGYGMYYGQSRSGVTGVVPYGAQGFNQTTTVVTTYKSDGATPYLHLNNPFPNGLIQPQGSKLGLLNDIGHDANGPLLRPGTNQTPYEESWSLGVERELPGNMLINVEYIGKKGTHLPFSGSTSINHLGPEIESYTGAQITALNQQYTNPDALPTPCSPPFCNPFFGIITDPNSSMSSSVPGYQMLLPFPQFTNVSAEPKLIANSIYHSLQLTAEKRYSNGLQLLATFVWSKSIDDASNADDNVTWLGSFSSLQDPNKPWLERSLSTFDIPYVVQFSYTYDLPFGRGKRLAGNMPRWADLIVGGWKTNGIWRIADGRPLAFTLADGNALPTYGQQRPNIVGTPKRSHGSDQIWVNQYFADTSVFQRTPDFTLGDAPRAYGGLRTPWSFTADLSLAKQFVVREEMNLELRIEAHNAFNHPVFSAPNTSVDDSSFGQITGTSVGPREVQLAIKFNF